MLGYHNEYRFVIKLSVFGLCFVEGQIFEWLVKVASLYLFLTLVQSQRAYMGMVLAVCDCSDPGI